MANNKKISQLNALSAAANVDIFAIVDVSSIETKKITLADLMGSPGPIGTSNPDTAAFTVLTMGGVPITSFTTDTELSGNSDISIPTEKAVKSYVDSAVVNVVSLDIRHVYNDTTATIGQILLVDTTNGDVSVELVPTGNGKIIIYKNSGNNNKITITPLSGSTLNGSTSSVEINFPYSSLEFLCDSTNFYTI